MTTQIAVVWNPTKTDRESLEAALTQATEGARELDVRWWETTADDPGQGAAKAALAAGAELVIVAGGDGTVRAVAEHMAESAAEADMAIVPLGTGNLFARNLDVPINDAPAAFARALEGEARVVDVGWVDAELTGGPQRHAFLVLVGFGIDAQMIVETDEDLKDKAGWLAYVESLGRAVGESDLTRFRIATDGAAARSEEGHTLLVGNCGSLQGGMTLLPAADPFDGELDYIVLSAEGTTEWLGTLKNLVWDNGLMRLVGKSDAVESNDSVNHGRAKSVDVSLDEPQAFEIDGEEMGETTGFTVSIQPGAIRVR